MPDRPKPIVLIVLDGWGENPRREGNALALARLPFYKTLLDQWPHTRLQVSGEAVGLPDGQMGNSEVGHLNMGAGRIVYQDLTRINKAIQNGDLTNNSVLQGLFKTVRQQGGRLHLLGLLSDGGVHSHQDHLVTLMDLAQEAGIERIAVHPFLDGRDTPPQSGIHYLNRLSQDIARRGLGCIATLMGRYYAMDRDNRWDRIEKAYNAIVLGQGHRFTDTRVALEGSYKQQITDEFVIPAVITGENGVTLATVGEGDGAIFFNFRADRARELTRALTEKDFRAFPRKTAPPFSLFVCMTRYDDTLKLPVLFEPVTLNNILGELLSRLGLRQLRIAETEKYAHVTYFFNGGEEQCFSGEDRKLIPSPKEVATYDQKPQMSAPEVTEELLKRLESHAYDFIVLNFANPDMVGHTGKLKAAIQAAEVIDDCLKRIITKVQELGGVVLLTADHGNLEQMIDYETGAPHTAHTTNLVPCILVGRRGLSLREGGTLADVAPTILDLMSIEKPREMTGRSLIQT